MMFLSVGIDAFGLLLFVLQFLELLFRNLLQHAWDLVFLRASTGNRASRGVA